MTPDEIRTLRERLGWSMNEMARQLDVSPATVWSWEHGEYRPGRLREAVLLQLRGRLNEAEREQRRLQFIDAIKGLAIGSGIGFLLGALFKEGAVEDEHADDNATSETEDES